MKVNLSNVTTGNNVSAINDNFSQIADALNNGALYRDNPSGEANQMDNLLDMNGMRIINLPTPVDDNDAARLKDIEDAIAGANTASLVTFSPYGDITGTNVQSAMNQEIQKRMNIGTIIPVDPRDYGADASGTTDSSTAIYNALKTGRPVDGGGGKYRISAPIVWDQNEDIDVGADNGNINQLTLRNVYKDAGAFTALSIRNMRRPLIYLNFLNGGGGTLTDIGVDWQNVEGMYHWISGYNFNGLLVNYDGTQGRWVENAGGVIFARKCLKAFQLQGPSGTNTGTGKIDMIWDVLPSYGSNFVNLSDLSVNQIENTVLSGTFSATTSLGIVNCTSSHFGKISLGNGAPTLLNINQCTNVDIDNLYVLGGGDNTTNTSTVTGVDLHSNALLKINNLSALSCQTGVLIGNSTNLDIGRFQGLQNQNDFVYRGAANVVAHDTQIENYFSQQCLGESVTVDAATTSFTGTFRIGTGRIRTGNLLNLGTTAVNLLSPASPSGIVQTRISNFDIDVETSATPYTTSLKLFYRGAFSGRGNRFMSATAVLDSYSGKGATDGTGFVMENPPSAFATWAKNNGVTPMYVSIPLRFETTSIVGEHVTLQLMSLDGTVYDLVDTEYLGTTITAPKYFTLHAIVPPGWQYQYLTSNSANTTFATTPRSFTL